MSKPPNVLTGKDWESVFDAVPDGIAIVSNDYRIVRVNRALARRLGATPDELAGRICHQCFHKSSEPPPNCPHRKLMEDGKEHSADIFEEGLGGWFAVTDSPLRNSDGSFNGSVHVFRDITVRKQAENQHRLLCDLAQELLSVTTASNAMSACVSMARRLGGVDSGGAYLVDNRDGGLRLVYHHGLSQRFVEAVRRYEADSPHSRLVAEGRPVYVRHSLLEVGLNRVEIEESLRALAILPVCHAGRLVGCLNLVSHTEDEIPSVHRSILETIAAQAGSAIARLEAEGQLRESEAKYRRLIETTTDVIYSMGVDGVVTYVGPQVARYGFNPGQLIGRHFLDLVDPEDRTRVETDFHRALKTGEVFPTVFRLTTPLDRIVWVEDCGTLSRDGNGAPTGLSGVLRDVTAREIAGRALEEANRELERRVLDRTEELARARDMALAASHAKSEFLANMSHELRTPLNSVIGFAGALEERYFGGLTDKQAEYVRYISESGRHLLEVINDILDLSKVEAGKMTFNPGPVCIGELLDDCLTMIREKCLNRGITVDLDLPHELRGVTIFADGRKLKQVLFNLLSNAAKFTPRGGEIVVEGRLVAEAGREREGASGKAVDHAPAGGFPNWFRVAVTDTGVGIPVECQDRLFEPFYQVSAGTMDKTPGTGLGLCLSKRLIELHGGRIVVESEGKGKGCRAAFWIPAMAAPCAARRGEQVETTGRV